jgi:hypothetical protein
MFIFDFFFYHPHFDLIVNIELMFILLFIENSKMADDGAALSLGNLAFYFYFSLFVLFYLFVVLAKI